MSVKERGKAACVVGGYNVSQVSIPSWWNVWCLESQDVNALKKADGHPLQIHM